MDTWHTHEVTCPHCLYEYSDSWEFPEWVEEEICPECKKMFTVERNISITYTTNRIEKL